MREIADFVTETERKLTVLRQLFRIGILVNAIDCWNRAFFQFSRDRFVCRFRLGKRFTGPPGHCHGGIIATILDEAMGKVNKLRHVIALTSEITVNYLKPVPLNQSLRVESREVRVRGRQHVNMAEILNAKGEVLARSRGLFIAIDPKRMFARFVDK